MHKHKNNENQWVSKVAIISDDINNASTTTFVIVFLNFFSVIVFWKQNQNKNWNQLLIFNILPSFFEKTVRNKYT